MNRKLTMIGTAILAVLVLAAGVLVATRKPSFRGTVINPPAPAADIKLTDSNGQPFSLTVSAVKSFYYILVILIARMNAQRPWRSSS